MTKLDCSKYEKITKEKEKVIPQRGQGLTYGPFLDQLMNALFKNWRSFQDFYLQYLSAFLPSLTLLAIVRGYPPDMASVSFFEWQQDAVTYGILSGIFLFFGITQTRNAHLRVTVILMLIRDNFGTAGQIISTLLVILGQFIGIILCGYVILYSIDVSKR